MSTCTIADCGAPLRARGWCHMHYERWYRNGFTDLRPKNHPAPDGMKVCRKCGETKPLDGFTTDKKSADGRAYWCRVCHVGATKRWQRSAKYGISVEEFGALAARQGGLCAICGSPPIEGKTRLDVDHDHQTLRVRGLLCSPCNRGIGLLSEEPARLRSAAAYLERDPMEGD